LNIFYGFCQNYIHLDWFSDFQVSGFPETEKPGKTWKNPKQISQLTDGGNEVPQGNVPCLRTSGLWAQLTADFIMIDPSRFRVVFEYTDGLPNSGVGFIIKSREILWKLSYHAELGLQNNYLAKSGLWNGYLLFHLGMAVE